MSTLVDAVVVAVSRKGFEDVTAEQVAAILDGAGIQAGAAAGVPVRLRVVRLRFSGNKTLSGGTAGTPFSFDWDVPDGVVGISSGVNFRGKTSVLLVIQWALTGRCQLQDNVRSWIGRVDVRFRLDNTVVDVAFDDIDDTPLGEAVLVETVDGAERRTTLGRFDSDQSFEALMGALMLERLRLDAIAMWSDAAEAETSHRWPAYTAALTVRADRLDPILGNEGVLATRMLQMFAGTSWATPVTQAATASRGLAHRAAQAQAKAQSVTTVSEAARAAAEDRVAAARASYESFGDADPDVVAMLDLTAKAHDLAQAAHQVELKLIAAKTAAAQIGDQLNAEKLRRNQQMEDALARLFFNRMEPTVCPRCAAGVTAERKKAEPEDHTCSVCTHDLDLTALEGNVVVATSVPAETRRSLVEAAASAERERASAEDDEEGDVVGALHALQNASAKAEQVVEALTEEYLEALDRRDAATERAKASSDQVDAAKARQAAAMDLARAEGALESLTGQTPIEVPEGPDALTVAVVDAAHTLLRKWLKEDQDPHLAEISTEITALARSFGSDNLDSVKLIGNCTMQVTRGGVTSGYGDLTSGEKLRLKLATTIALIKYGYDKGVGRHPGLLFIDSPAAEEIPEANLETMLTELRQVAADSGIQVFVATRYGNVVKKVLPDDHVIVAEGNDPVW
jgi:hypothetical protein